MTKFDGLTFKQGLTKVGVPNDQAEALSGLIRDQVVANPATKEDLLHLEERLRSELKQLGQQTTIKLGSLSIAGVVIILTAMALFV